VSEGLRNARTLGSKERPVAGDMLLGMIRHHRALAHLAGLPEAGASLGLLDAWMLLAEQGIPDRPDPADPYAVATSVPEALAAEWWGRLGPERARAHAIALAGRAPVALRVLRGPVELPVPVHAVGADGLVLEGRCNLDTVPAAREGRVIVQDLGSQRIVDAAWAWAQEAGEAPRVLDLCAGAGGKSLALAALGARVQAWDLREDALRELSRRASRAGLRVEVGAPRPGSRFDLVLVDAPCSGTGVLRRHPESRWKLRFPTDSQAGLLARARTLAPRVVYATCSLAEQENEQLVRSVTGEPRRETTTWPAEGAGEGFYWAEIEG
jgi:16S rRNA (cytosine967-C5)-methyltransferase